MNFQNIQCLTLDTAPLSHREQIEGLCAAGAKWIQLRMKAAGDEEVAAVAEGVLPLCREHQCRLIINDRVQVARRVGADGVHLGKNDMPWREARDLAGGRLLIGGTVNSVEDARAARASGCLDYVGVGPFRFTRSKQNLAPVLRGEQWREIRAILGDFPAYAIGGITPEDLPQVRSLGLHGIAISAALYRHPELPETYRSFASHFDSFSPYSNKEFYEHTIGHRR